MESLENKTILITGGSKGIGYGIAEVLIHQRAKVAVTSRSLEAAEKAAVELNRLGKGEAIGMAADVRNANDLERAVALLLKKWGRLDVLVANAGIGYFASIENLTAKQWQETIDTNLTGVFHSIQASIPALKESRGYIITMASLAGVNFFAGASAYNASKFGLVGFTQAVMLDLRASGIRVTTIMPGSVATHFGGHEPSPEDEWKIQPEDIGQIVVDILRMNRRTLPSKIEVRPSIPPGK
jgi:NAD(P)-dependent dehydrogenase (short-subunit alcohol dehydrogenase family)